MCMKIIKFLYFCLSARALVIKRIILCYSCIFQKYRAICKLHLCFFKLLKFLLKTIRIPVLLLLDTGFFFTLVPVCRKCFERGIQITLRFVIATTAEIFFYHQRWHCYFISVYILYVYSMCLCNYTESYLSKYSIFITCFFSDIFTGLKWTN